MGQVQHGERLASGADPDPDAAALLDLAEDLLAMTTDERLETLRRYVALRESVEAAKT